MCFRPPTAQKITEPCPQCGTAKDPAAVCLNCGYVPEVACPKCGAKNPVTSEQCANCGFKAPKAPPPPGQSSGVKMPPPPGQPGGMVPPKAPPAPPAPPKAPPAPPKKPGL
jgi:ribosomal protein L32